MRYLSICSGIEAATTAWHPLGWKPVAFSEIEPFPSAVLAHHWPETPNLGDMNNYHDWPKDLNPDLLVGGTPCQSFSVAGLRQGLDDLRGQLMLTFVEIAAKYRPHWLVWENVPGVLSSNEGEDFASLLGLLTGRKVRPPSTGWQNTGFLAGHPAAYSIAWRVLDAQHFGVPQRRRRVFIVGHLTDWRRAAAVLLEPHSLRRNPAPGPLTPEETSGTLGARTCRSIGVQDAESGHLIAATVSAKWSKGTGGPAGDECQNLAPVSFAENSRKELTLTGGDGQITNALSTGGGKPGQGRPTIVTKTPAILPSVRRLTPLECERLQGFPDRHTAIPYKGKPASKAPDGPRYKAIGNSMAVPVMAWLGRRIAHIDTLAQN